MFGFDKILGQLRGPGFRRDDKGVNKFVLIYTLILQQGDCGFAEKCGWGGTPSPATAGSAGEGAGGVRSIASTRQLAWGVRSIASTRQLAWGVRSIVRKGRGAVLLLLSLALLVLNAPAQSVKIGLLKYNGGGDWYVNPTSLPNLIKFCNETMNTDIDKDPVTVEPGSRDIFNLPFVHMTGHGNFLFSPQEADNLRQYLLAGGFLHIDDNYGLDQFVRREMKKVFPEQDFVELPASHPIFQKPNPFPDGLPKIHEHDGKRPQGFGLIHEGRLVCFYSYESDLGDGWEDPAVHNDSQETRMKALKMGANLIHYVFTEK